MSEYSPKIVVDHTEAPSDWMYLKKEKGKKKHKLNIPLDSIQELVMGSFNTVTVLAITV